MLTVLHTTRVSMTVATIARVHPALFKPINPHARGYGCQQVPRKFEVSSGICFYLRDVNCEEDREIETCAIRKRKAAKKNIRRVVISKPGVTTNQLHLFTVQKSIIKE